MAIRHLLKVLLLTTILTSSSSIKLTDENFSVEDSFSGIDKGGVYFSIEYVTINKRNTPLTYKPKKLNYTSKSLHIQNSVMAFMPKFDDDMAEFIEYLKAMSLGLTEITGSDLKQFRRLETLILAINKIKILEEGLFEHNSKLKSVDFRYNKIISVAYGVFGVISLSNVYFADNTCFNFNFPSKNFTDYGAYVKELENKCLLKGDKDFRFSGEDSLYKLTIENLENDDDIMQRKAFHIENHTDKDVKMIIITNIHLAQFPKYFTKYEEIEILEVHGSLRKWERDDMKAFQKLKEINLSNNLLTYLHSNVFHHTREHVLETIDLRNNRLQSIGVAIFDGIPSLKRIYLLNNFCINRDDYDQDKIEELKQTIKSGTCAMLDSVECHLSKATLPFVGTVETCIITAYDLKKFLQFKFVTADRDMVDWIYGVTGKHSSFIEISDIKAIRAHDRDFGRMPLGIEVYFPNIQSISMTFCGIMNLFLDNFYELKNLKYLNLSRNNIVHIPYGIFENNHELIFVDFRDNHLTSVSSRIFILSQKLQFAFFSDNKCIDHDFVLADDKEAKDLIHKLANKCDYVVQKHLAKYEMMRICNCDKCECDEPFSGRLYNSIFPQKKLSFEENFELLSRKYKIKKVFGETFGKSKNSIVTNYARGWLESREECMQNSSNCESFCIDDVCLE